MRVNMADINKKANAIINEVVGSGEAVQIYKHGVAIAEIRPLTDSTARDVALQFILNTTPRVVDQSINSVIAKGRKRGV